MASDTADAWRLRSATSLAAGVLASWLLADLATLGMFGYQQRMQRH